MKLKDFCFSSKKLKPVGIISNLGVSWCRAVGKCQEGIPKIGNAVNSRYVLTLVKQHSLGDDTLSRQGISVVGKKALWRLGTQSSCIGKSSSMNQQQLSLYRSFGNTTNDPSLSRDWLAKLWLMDLKAENLKRKRRQRVQQHAQTDRQLFSDANVTKEKSTGKSYTVQPPVSQSTTGFLQPASPEEFKVAPLLARSNLLITRDIEWANLMLGFEQENRYAVVDPCYPQGPVGFISEQSNIIARQILRTRRPFVAYITDAMGNELFKVRRPFWWINSTIFVEVDGKEIGVVHRRWHLWRRVYDLYLGAKQFAVVENPGFWNWTFTLKDVDGKVLAAIDRDWRGFGFELLTDAGQYVIRFGNADPVSKTGPARLIEDLEISRPLTLSERAVVLALAVSLDNDYFSRHGGWGVPFLVAGE